MELKFSVLMSVYFKEQPKYLDLSLKSITDAQILKPNEIVLVKDGPLTKELDEVIDKYILKYNELFKIVSLNKNGGLGNALNVGLQQCTYDLVARMDTDDISKPERFKEQIEIFKHNPQLDIVGSWIDEFEVVRDEIRLKATRKVSEATMQICCDLKKICAFNHVTVMFKKNKIIEVGNYSDEFQLEDYYLWIRLAINKCKMYNIQKSLVLVRMDINASLRRGGFKLLKSDIRFQKKLYDLNYISKSIEIYNILRYIIYRLLPGKLRRCLQIVFYRK